MTNDDILQSETFAERRRLAALLAQLTEQQWETPSLCAGWRVREVVAHVTMPYRMTSPEQFHAGLEAHDFDFNKYADHEAHETTKQLSDADLLALYCDNVEHPWRPPGGGSAGALSHDVIHGLDITEALDLPQAPPGRIALVLANAGAKNLEFFGTDPERLQPRGLRRRRDRGRGCASTCTCQGHPARYHRPSAAAPVTASGDGGAAA
ncbi:MAG: maleylpyruvate isomerase family mycothiol-dependent enzyme [Nocardioides sp.]